MRLDQMTPEGDRKFTFVYWASMAVVTAICIYTVLADIAPGLGPEKHPSEYLLISNIAIFLLISVIPVLRLVGVVRMPWWFNFVLTFDVYLYVVSLTCGFYKEPSMEWWGFLGHTCSSLSVGAICFLALCLIAKHSPADLRYGKLPGLLLLLFVISLSFGGIWEVMEGYVDIITGTAYMSYGVFDSLQDLEADALGSLIMVAIAAFLLKDRTPEEVAAGTHLGRRKKNRNP